MSTSKEIARLARLIAAQHGWGAAKQFKSFEMSEAAGVELSQCAVDLRKAMPSMPLNSLAMSAAFAVALERRLEAPIHVVTGTLGISGQPVLADGMPGGQGGHAWVMVGPYVADYALFPLAYSREAPAELTRHIDLVFGPGKALYVDLWKRARQSGLTYDPQYVLSADEVTAAMGIAYDAMRKSAAEKG